MLLILLIFIVCVGLVQYINQTSSKHVKLITLQDGDLFFSRSNVVFSPSAIFPPSSFSHVGIIVDGKVAHFSRGGGLKIQTLKELQDSNYYAHMAVRRCHSPIDREVLQSQIMRFKHTPFSSSYREMINAFLDMGSPFQNTKNLDSLFCSEFVAQLLQENSILDQTVPANEYTPKDLLYISGYDAPQCIYQNPHLTLQLFPS